MRAQPRPVSQLNRAQGKRRVGGEWEEVQGERKQEEPRLI